MSHKSTKEVLLEARSLIEKGWCQGALAVSAAGRTVDAEDRRAVAFCAIGALRKATWSDEGLPWNYDAQWAVAKAVGAANMMELSDFNDAPATTQQAVLAAFDAAIAAVEEGV